MDDSCHNTPGLRFRKVPFAEITLVNFSGPKMGHMAVRQSEVAAANLAAEIDGHEPISTYIHEMRLVIDEGGSDSIYVYKDLWVDEPANVRQGRFWSWAKRVQEKYWEASHS